jgi:hypothetical protein
MPAISQLSAQMAPSDTLKQPFIVSLPAQMFSITACLHFY